MTLLLLTQVLEVNGHSCVDIDHYEAVGILKAAGSYITLRVVREIDPDATSSSLPPTLHTQQQVEQTDQKISQFEKHLNFAFVVHDVYRQFWALLLPLKMLHKLILDSTSKGFGTAMTTCSVRRL